LVVLGFRIKYNEIDSFFILLQKFDASIITLKEGIDDTSLVLWSDIYRVALSYYNYVHLAAENDVPGATTVYQDLSSIFEGRGRKKKSNKRDEDQE
jgi:hypothetical protein